MYVTTQNELDKWCQVAKQHGILGIDLEFIPENTFYPQLALVQLAVGAELLLVDPLGDLDLSGLDALVLDPDVCKVVHAGSQDMAIFYNRTGRVPRNVFDTQLAAAFIGSGHQISYGQMVKLFFGVSLNKGHAYSNWLKRPLSRNQEKYALDDVRFLLDSYGKILQKLNESGRLNWVLEELFFYQREDFYVLDPALAYTKVKKGQSLRGKEFNLVSALASWREMEARNRNRPRRKILQDDVLVEIARQSPRSRRELGEIRGMFGRDLKKYGDGILRSVTEGLAQKGTGPERTRKSKLEPDEEMIVDFLVFCLRAFCTSEQIAPAHVGSKADVETLVRQYLDGALKREDHSLLCGWRAQAVGEKLLKCLDGQIGVKLDGQQKKIVFTQ